MWAWKCNVWVGWLVGWVIVILQFALPCDLMFKCPYAFVHRARALRSATSSGSAVSPAATVGAGNSDESSGLYLKQFVYSKAAQYRKLKMEWKTNVFLGRSNIQVSFKFS